jgi:endogenous inhibitor of DNA gyrase (YacG/DUF329 family)
MCLAICAICGKQFDLQQSEAAPFCSQRCRLVDLGRWFREERGLPVEPDDDDDEEQP